MGEGKSDSVGNESQASGILGDTEQTIEEKLARANAIRSLLSGTIVKKKGDVYADIDSSIRDFLQRELDEIFSPQHPSKALTDDEITVLKAMAQRVLDKM